jgi:hypothetical protein
VRKEIQALHISNKIARKELHERREFYLQMIEGAELREIIEVDNV